MKRFRVPLWSFCLLFVSGLILVVHAQQRPVPFQATIGNSVSTMSGDWLFHTGDNAGWASAGLDDSGWETIKGDSTWGSQTHPGYAGFAWYRRTIDVKAGGGPVSILMPHVDDAYELYFDGQLIGHSGNLPPNAVWYIRTTDAFPLPAPDAQGEVKGVLAVRVWKAMLGSTDGNALGGLNDQPQIGDSRVIQERLDLGAAKQQRMRVARSVTSFTMLIIGAIAIGLWLVDRRRTLNLWLGVFLLAFGGLLPRDFPEYFRHVSYFGDQLFIQLVGCGQDLGTWMLVLTIFGLTGERRWRLLTGVLAVIYATAQITDCIVFLFWTSNWRPLQTLDGVATAIYTVMPLYLFVLLVAGVRRRPDIGLLPLVLACAVLEMYQVVVNGLGQFIRFTHISIADVVAAAAIHIGPNYVVSLQTQIGLVTLIVLVWTVLREQARERRQQTALQAEVKSAREVQQVLVPEAMEPVPGFAISSLYWPADEVGGDLFQVLPGRNGDALVVLADVSGKGLKAAMTVSVMVGAIRTLSEYTVDPMEILHGLNRRLMGRTDGGFATCLVLHVGANGEVTMGNAGHLAPFLNGEEMAMPGSLPLGISADAEFEQSRFALHEGDEVTLYTDGVLEAQSKTGELYGFDRTKALMRSKPSVKTIAEAARSFGQKDDVTLVKIARVREADTRPSISVDLQTVALREARV